MLNFKIIGFLIFWGLSSDVTAEQITLYAEDNFYPFSTQTGDGLSNRLVAAAYQSMDIDVQYEVMPFARLMRTLDQGKGLGGLNSKLNDENYPHLLYGKQPIYVGALQFYYHKDSPVSVTQISDINNPLLVLGQVNGYYYPPIMKESNSHKQQVQSDQHLIRMMLLGRVNAGLMMEKVVEYHSSKLNIDQGLLIKAKDIKPYPIQNAVVFFAIHTSKVNT